MMRKKILFSYYSMDIGGSTTSLLSLMNNLNPEKYDMYLILYRNTGALLPYIPKHVTVLKPAVKEKNVWQNIKKMCRILFSSTLYKGLFYQIKHKEKKYPVTLFSEMQAKYLSRKINMKFDVAIGGMEGWSDKYIAYRVDADIKMAWFHSLFSKISETPKLERDWIERITYIVNISKACEYDFLNCLPQYSEKCIIIKNMLSQQLVSERADEIIQDKEYEEWKKYKGFKVITVARLDPAKALYRVIKCAIILKEKKYDFKWMIIGDGGEKETLQQMVIENNLEQHVLLVGAKMNPYPFMKESKVFCLTSHYEGTPVTVKESMMLGVIPVVTRYKSVTDQIDNRRTGIVVENEDTTVADALCELYNCEELQNEIRNQLINMIFDEKATMHCVDEILKNNRKG